MNNLITTPPVIDPEIVSPEEMAWKDNDRKYHEAYNRLIKNATRRFHPWPPQEEKSNDDHLEDELNSIRAASNAKFIIPHQENFRIELKKSLNV